MSEALSGPGRDLAVRVQRLPPQEQARFFVALANLPDEETVTLSPAALLFAAVLSVRAGATFADWCRMTLREWEAAVALHTVPTPEHA